MSNEILVDVGKDETRVAILENEELVEFYIENKEKEKMVGNIYRGKVSSVLPGMQAAFIDIGYEKNAFLYVRDAVLQNEFEEEKDEQGREYNITDILKAGQEITVQVIKEPLGTKGPRVTTHLTLPGRYVILLPNADYVGISRRIEDEEKRLQLKDAAQQIRGDMGLIIRTAAEDKTAEDFKDDIKFLTNLWATIHKREKKGEVPRCIYKDENIIFRTVRDFFTNSIDKLIINDEGEYNKVLELVGLMSPNSKLKVQYFNGDENLFEKYQINHFISKALLKKVWLKCGGYLIIEETEALTVIDVNTGKYIGIDNLENTVLRTNLEAAKEIARQLRLRDIGGIIIIDFIDMNEIEHQNMIIETMKEELKKDRTKTTVVGMTGLGLIEMTRKKIRQKLSSVLQYKCPNCDGTGRCIKDKDVEARSQ